VAAINVLVNGLQLCTFPVSGKLGRTSQNPRFGTKVFNFFFWGGGSGGVGCVLYIGVCLVVSSLSGRTVVPTVVTKAGS